MRKLALLFGFVVGAIGFVLRFGGDEGHGADEHWTEPLPQQPDQSELLTS